MRRPRATRARARRVSDMRVGRYVELRGVLRADAPVEGPVSREPMVGWELLCTVFVGDDVRRLDAHRWGGAVLEDASGVARLALSSSTLKMPAHAEETFTDPAQIAKLAARVGLTFPEGTTEVQALERGVSEGRAVAVCGFVSELAGPADAYRSSARPPRGLSGDPRRPLVIHPR